MYKPVQLDVQGRAVWRLGGAEQLGRAAELLGVPLTAGQLSEVGQEAL